MAASYREVWAFEGIKREQIGVEAVARACRFRVRAVTASQAALHCGLNARSWGERLDLHFAEAGNALLVDAKSTSYLAVEDWGKNARNVQCVKKAMVDVLNEPARVVPFCRHCGYPRIDGHERRCSECGSQAGLVLSWSPTLAERLRSVALYFLLLTVVELVVVNSLPLLGVGPIGIEMFAGPPGAVRLLVLNGVVLGSVVVLGALFRPKSSG